MKARRKRLTYTDRETVAPLLPMINDDDDNDLFLKNEKEQKMKSKEDFGFRLFFVN